MFLKTHRENPTAMLIVFSLFALAITILCGAANIADAQTNKGTYLDFTGDGKTDWAVIGVQPTSNHPYRWKILGNQTGSPQTAPFIRIFDYGLVGDTVVPGDYTGDRKADPTVWRPDDPQGIFYVAQIPTGTDGIKLDRAVPWGIGGLNRDGAGPQGDYDGDGKMDYTVVRYNATGGFTWYILSSKTYTWRSVDFGFRGGSVLPGADFTGDGRDELVFTADNNGHLVYYIGDAVTGTLVLVRQWGFSSFFIDRHLPPADYTGDGKADLVVVRENVNPMVWYILDPATNKFTATPFGISYLRPGDRPSDSPVQGDYDGDGKFDIAVYRSSNHTFYVLKSSDGGVIIQSWGEDGDDPLSIGYFAFIVG